MIIYGLQTGLDKKPYRLFLTKELATDALNKIKNRSDSKDRILKNTDTEYQIEWSYKYKILFFDKEGNGSLRWFISEIEVEE